MSPTSRMTDRGAYTYISAFSAALYAVLLTAPVIGGTLTREFGLTSTQLGLLFSVELGALSLATVPAYLWLRRVDLRTASYLAAGGVVLGNVVSGFIDSYPWLVVVRLLTVLAAGSLTVIILSLGPHTRNPGRAFGLFVVCQLAMGALILAVFPLIFAAAPVAAVYWTLAGLIACCLPAVRLIDGDFLRAATPATGDASDAAVNPGKFVLGLAAVLCFYIALSGVWTFMQQIGTAAGIDPATSSVVLSVATVAGIASALIAALRGDTPRRTQFLLGGFLAMALSIGLLFAGPAVARFAIAAIVFKFAWTFILPYLLSALSELGSGGHVMNTTNLMIGSGLVVGPLMAGILIDGSGGAFGPMLTVSLVGVLVSLTLVFAARPARRRPEPAEQVRA